MAAAAPQRALDPKRLETLSSGGLTLAPLPRWAPRRRQRPNGTLALHIPLARRAQPKGSVYTAALICYSISRERRWQLPLVLVATDKILCYIIS